MCSLSAWGGRPQDNSIFEHAEKRKCFGHLKCDPRGRIAAYDQTSHELLDDDLRLDFQFGPILGNIYVHTVFVSE